MLNLQEYPQSVFPVHYLTWPKPLLDFVWLKITDKTDCCFLNLHIYIYFYIFTFNLLNTNWKFSVFQEINKIYLCTYREIRNTRDAIRLVFEYIV